jgi:hypothetical protein
LETMSKKLSLQTRKVVKKWWELGN